MAGILGLHVRTVRGYVRDGRLPAVRIGKQYRVAREDVEKLTGGRAGGPAGSVVARPRAEVSAIVQVDGIDSTAMSRVTALVSGALSNRSGEAPPLHVETVYDQQRRGLKIVVIGGADDAAKLVGIVGAFAEAEL